MLPILIGVAHSNRLRSISTHSLVQMQPLANLIGHVVKSTFKRHRFIKLKPCLNWQSTGVLYLHVFCLSVLIKLFSLPKPEKTLSRS